MIETDAVIIGAGPVGLYQAFQLGLLEVGAHLVDALPAAGGQCIELYPDKPIFDIPGIARCSGRELADRLMAQIAPFATPMHLGQLVNTLQREPDGRFRLGTSAGQQFMARSLFIAAGVGAFQPRTLKIEGIEVFEGNQLLHHVPEPEALAGHHVLVLGDDDLALAAATALALTQGVQQPASVTLIHRREVFQAGAEAVAQMRAACAAGRLQFIAAQAVGLQVQAGRLTGLQLAHADGQTLPQRADMVLALLGLSPKLGPIADWGLAMAKRQLTVDTEQFQTSVPGIHAVGDINHYPGKRKLIACGFHEATLAAYGAAQRLRPDQPLLLQYTTTSPRLHRLLGVDEGGAPT